MKAIVVSALAGWLLAVPVWAQDSSDDEGFSDALSSLGDNEDATPSFVNGTDVEQDLLEWVYFRDSDTDAPFASFTDFL
ncbi:MAG: transglycosylase-like protein, partial [Octadecabacter sp.]